MNENPAPKRNINKKVVIAVVAVLILLCCICLSIISAIAIYKRRVVNVSSFEECVANGGAIAESYPRQCFLDGKGYTEEIEPTPTASDLPTGTPTQTPTPTPTPDLEEDELFTNISAKLPQGWSIKVILSTALEDNGIPVGAIEKIEILKNNVKQVEIAALSGIGGSGQCSQVYKFSDSNLEYINEQIQTNETYFEHTPPTVNLGNNYEAFNLLGGRFRRISDKYWFDVTGKEDPAGATTYFDIDCAFSSLYLVDGLSPFSIKQFTAVETDLKIVDEILNSFEGLNPQMF